MNRMNLSPGFLQLREKLGTEFHPTWAGTLEGFKTQRGACQNRKVTYVKETAPPVGHTKASFLV